ncbi:MAG: hypothetical protein V1781_03925, partial [Bacteroidota bacterium]
TVMLISRDAAEMATYGIDASISSFIANKTRELKDLSTDEELAGIVSDLTEKKNEKAEAVKMAIRGIMARAKNAFGEQSAKFRRFGTKGMDEMRDVELYRCGKRVIRVAQTYLAELTVKGLTQAIIDDLKNTNTIFDDKIDLKDDAERQRDIATANRISMANQLYSKIVEVCDYGKEHWKAKNEAKYNDYVIYEMPPQETQGTPTPPPVA